MLGTLPIAIGFGAGAEVAAAARASGRGKLLFFQLVKLYVTADIYVSFDNLRKRWGKGGEADRFRRGLFNNKKAESIIINKPY